LGVPKIDHHKKPVVTGIKASQLARFFDRHPQGSTIKTSLNLGTVYLVGGFNPSEKYESQLGLLFPIYGKIKKMLETFRNHQPDIHIH